MALGRQPTLRLEIDGLRDLDRALKTVDLELKKDLRKMNKDAADMVKVVVDAPKVSGRLQKSVGTLATASRAQIKAGSAARVPYAPPIHWGWKKRGIKPNKFIYIAIKKKRREVKKVYEAGLERIKRRAKL